ncbi:hypothetical protein [Marinoscillum sp.]|uniref:hypothetical protein n=1 Tax=Marinoscillum sp. TaxID=2024838 RepID=UPI003BAD9C59
MNSKLILTCCFYLCFFSGIFWTVGAQGPDYGKCYSGNGGYYFDLTQLLQATGYLGGSERIELEVSGGNYAAYGRHTYLIHSRGGLTVEALEVGGPVNGYELKVFDTGAASNSSNKYRIGVKVNTGWASICVRARELQSREWMVINTGSLSTIPSLPEVSVSTRWLYKSQNELFEVGGTIRSKEIKVEASPWPDYVFAEDYDLMSLAEIADYITENQHLPGMPSAEEVADQGISLGEMNVRLLEKIEELTLHVIRLEKELNKLKNESNEK